MTKIMTTHPGEQELRRLFEMGLEAPDARQLVNHVKVCPACTRLIQRMRSFDSLLRRAVAEQAPKQLSVNVLRELGIPEESTIVYRAMQYAAPLFALIVVVAMVGAAFYFTGAYKQPELQSGLAGSASIYGKASTVVSTGTGAFTSWSKDYFSFLYHQRGLAMLFFLGLFFATVFLMDRFVFAKMMNRRVG